GFSRDWSSAVCSSDLPRGAARRPRPPITSNNQEPPMSDKDLHPDTPIHPTRRNLLKGMAGGALAAATGGIAGHALAASPAGGEDLTWMPAWRIRDLIARKDISPVEVTEQCLRRIRAVDGKLQSVMTVDHQG